MVCLHIDLFYFMWMSFSCMYVCAPCVYLCLWRPKEGISSPRTGISCDSPWGCWELNFDHLEELQGLLIADPISPAPLHNLVVTILKVYISF